MRVTVVGGGVIGLCTAWYLREGGAEVTVLEAARVGAGASCGNAGWVCPVLSGPLPAPGVASLALRTMFKRDSPVWIKPRPDLALASWLYLFWRRCTPEANLEGLHATARLAAPTMELYDGLAAAGVRFEMHADGLLFAAHDARVAEETLESFRPMAEHGYDLPDDVTDVRTIEPALSDEVRAGFLVREERHVDPASLVRGLARALGERGVRIVEGAPVRSVDGLDADAVVLAAGAWTTALARTLGIRIPMQAGKGYSVSVAADPMPRRPVYLLGAKVGATPLGGRLRLAGTMELSGVNARIDSRRVDAVVRSARRYLRRIDDVRDVWTGMRSVPADGLPVIGAARDGVFLATGHSMLGVTLAPATGRATAELILTGRTPPEIAPFSAHRSGVRAGGRRPEPRGRRRARIPR